MSYGVILFYEILEFFMKNFIQIMTPIVALFATASIAHATGMYEKSDGNLVLRAYHDDIMIKSLNSNLIIQGVKAWSSHTNTQCIKWTHNVTGSVLLDNSPAFSDLPPRYQIGKTNIKRGQPKPTAEQLGVVQPNGWKIRSGDILNFYGRCMGGFINKVEISFGNGSKKTYSLTENDRTNYTRNGGGFIESNNW